MGRGYLWLVKMWKYASEAVKTLHSGAIIGELTEDEGVEDIRDVNFKWIQDFAAKNPDKDFFPTIRKMGEFPKFLFWCLGYRCQGGGDCDKQNTKHTCTEYKGVAHCENKVGEDSQGACTIKQQAMNEFELKEKCENHM